MANDIVWSFGIVPVQAWIAQASRSRDLRAGSLFLSHLTARTITAITDEFSGAQLLLPRDDDGEHSRVKRFARPIDKLLGSVATEYALPNRATGVVSGADADRVAALFARLQSDCLDAAWQELIATVSTGGALQAACADQSVRQSLKAAMRRAPMPFHLVWALREVAPVTMTDTDSIIAALKHIEPVYAAVKRTRPVAADAGAPVGKCPNCGERESLQPAGDAPGDSEWARWRAFRAQWNQDTQIGKGSRFDTGQLYCGVCAIKRLAGYLGARQKFPSTAEIAARSWLDLAQKENTEWQAFEQAAGKLGDGAMTDVAAWCHPRKVRLAVQRDDDPAPAQTLLKKLDALGSAVARAIGPDNAVFPSPYLAVLVFDGDDMGKYVHLDPAGAAARVDAFATDLLKLLAQQRAQAFYVGGDEGLVLAPLDRTVVLANAINGLWREHFPDKPTLSMGVCVFDFERPLGLAIERAHHAIAEAKAHPGKNALAVTVQTASGSAWTTVAGWGDAWDRVAGAVDAIVAGELASGWAYDIQDLVRRFGANTLESDSAARAAARDEMWRLTRRHQLEEDNDSAIDVWSDRLVGQSWLTDAQPEVTADNLADRLQLISFLARATHFRAPAAQEVR